MAAPTESAPPSAPAGPACVEPEHMPGDVVERHAIRAGPAHIGQHGSGDVVPARHGPRRRAEDAPIGGTQHGGVGVGRAPDHGAVDRVEVRLRFVEAGDTAVDDHLQRRQVPLQAADHVVAERRDLPVLGRAQAVQHRDPRMHGQALHAGGGDRFDEGLQVLIGAPAVDTDAALDRDGNIDRSDHRARTVRHQIRRLHESGAEAAGADTGARAADIEIDLVVAENLAYLRRAGQRVGLRAAELEAHRMLRLVEGQQPVTIAPQHRLGMDHLAVEERARRDLPQ